MSVRDVGFFLRGRLSRAIARTMNRKAPPPAPPAPLEDVLRGPATSIALTRLLEGRDNAARQAAVARWLHARGVPFRRHRFATFEGAGENFAVDVGAGDRALVLIAHHDAVPKSPGANDNAAAVAIVLSLLARWSSREPRARVRLLFSACEEIGYLGARAWVREHGVADVRGVLSLELPGVGDSLAVWDAVAPTPFLGAVCGTLEGLGLRADEGHHVVGRIPVFGSDHRAFADAGVAAYGFTTVPAAEADALRQFVFHPLRSAVRASVRRPPPFDTYHTARDTGATLDAAALDRMAGALAALAEAG
ncbi:MAG TPA: M28 family peptidase [Methylomirabilota bacterium]|nr:M28 family peptidase [Methylomirabilota bacterium]